MSFMRRCAHVFFLNFLPESYKRQLFCPIHPMTTSGSGWIIRTRARARKDVHDLCYPNHPRTAVRSPLPDGRRSRRAPSTPAPSSTPCPHDRAPPSARTSESTRRRPLPPNGRELEAPESPADRSVQRSRGLFFSLKVGVRTVWVVIMAVRGSLWPLSA